MSTRRSIEVSPDELEEMASKSGAPIELPVGDGWARVTVAGRRYHAQWDAEVAEAVALTEHDDYSRSANPVHDRLLVEQFRQGLGDWGKEDSR